jgi:hypothetical protein
MSKWAVKLRIADQLPELGKCLQADSTSASVCGKNLSSWTFSSKNKTV